MKGISPEEHLMNNKIEATHGGITERERRSFSIL